MTQLLFWLLVEARLLLTYNSTIYYVCHHEML